MPNPKTEHEGGRLHHGHCPVLTRTDRLASLLCSWGAMRVSQHSEAIFSKQLPRAILNTGISQSKRYYQDAFHEGLGTHSSGVAMSKSTGVRHQV